MNKLILLALAVAVLPIVAGAQTVKKAAKKDMHCAVMPSNKIDIATATKKHMYADYKGRRYFFCCNGCPEAFKKDPSKYAKSDSIPTPKASTKSTKKNS